MPINQTFPYGKQGTIEYKPNWGQPITETGQWQGAPTSPVDVPPPIANVLDPFTVLNKNQNELKEHYKRREKTLKGYGLSQEAHNKAIAQMQQEYDESKFKFTSVRLQLDDIKRGMASGQIDPMKGLQAQMQLVAPQGTVEAMFPKPERQPTVGVTGVSPSGMASYVKRFETLREGMLKKVDPKWYKWDKKQAIPKEMVKRYFTERNIANLNDPRNAAKIPGFNQAFIQSMGEDERTAELITELLDPKTGDPRMLAAFSPDSSMNRAFMRQFETTKGVSPFARALKPKTPFRMKLQAMSPVGAALLYKELAGKRKAATRKLPTPKTKTEYDSLPSGAQYIGTDGQMRVKK